MIVYDSLGLKIQGTEKIHSSGEGFIWRTNRSGYLAKIYKSPTPERISKLQAMIKNPPKDPTRVPNHISIVWPCELLYQSINCVGFLMPEIKGAKELMHVYNPKNRQNSKYLSKFNWHYLHQTARNVASIIWGLHDKNYIVGDMKPQNLLVNDRGLVSIVDTDSFQVTDSTTSTTIHYCPVYTPEFTPPELLEKNISQIKQAKFHDCYRLAIVIYLLLFGYHPFQKGKWDSYEEQPTFPERVKKGLWLYNPNSNLTHDIGSIPLEVVTSEVQNLFLRAFNDGHKDPRQRPSAKEWYEALDTAISQLKHCSQINNHVYTLNYGKCYWCERANKLGTDIFDAPNSNTSASPPTTSNITGKKKSKIWVPVIFLFTILLLLFMLSRLVH